MMMMKEPEFANDESLILELKNLEAEMDKAKLMEAVKSSSHPSPVRKKNKNRSHRNRLNGSSSSDSESDISVVSIPKVIGTDTIEDDLLSSN